jgi:hypothetical protein
MNTPPSHDPAAYITQVLLLYLQLPETPLHASVQDRARARHWRDQEIPLSLVESALLLASLRRLLRSADALPLSPIRSLAYFQPVIDELIAHPPAVGYLDYLRHKLHHLNAPKTVPADVQNNTFSEDR